MASLISDEGLELGGRLVDVCQQNDSLKSDLLDKFLLSNPVSTDANLYAYPPPQRLLGTSGSSERDYVSLDEIGISGVREFVSRCKRPLPQELSDQFAHMQCNCAMGVFPEINRAWVSIDSDLFMWNYETGTDLAYFDGLPNTIMCVGLGRPKRGIFTSDIQYLLVITTAADLAILGVNFTDASNLPTDESLESAEMHLLPDPFYQISLDGVVVTDIKGTANGRIFLAAKDGCLYEIEYKERGFFRSSSCKKINHSKGVMSYLLPSFVSLAFGSEESLEQIVIDETRHILFSRSEKGTIQVFDLGSNGNETCKVCELSGEALQSWACRLAQNIEMGNFKPVIDISPLFSSDSLILNLIATTHTGVRFYISTYPTDNLTGYAGGLVSQDMARPTTLRLCHVRLPPGFSAGSMVSRPQNVHLALSRKEYSVLLSATSEEVDVAWGLSGENFPFSPCPSESLSQMASGGRSWRIVEKSSAHSEKLEEVWRRLSPTTLPPPRPPLVVRQHTATPTPIFILSTQGVHVLEKQRPVDLLRQLLLEYGPDSSQVKAFFQVHQKEQGAAMCLILASSQSAQASQGIAEAAVRALVVYGGDPQMVFPAEPAFPAQDSPVQFRRLNGSVADWSQLPGSPVQSSTPHQSPVNMQSPFRPLTPRGNFPGNPQTNLVGQEGMGGGGRQEQTALSSTLVQKRDGGGAGAGMEIRYSSIHNGLYLYFARVVGSLWQMRMVREVVGPSLNNLPPLESTFTSEELTWFVNQLDDFSTFLNTHSLIPSAHSIHTSDPLAGGDRSSSLQQRVIGFMRPDIADPVGQQRSQLNKKHRVEAMNAERQSLLRLGCVVERCREVLGLWRVLTDHQFPVVLSQLPPDLCDTLTKISFRGLVVSGKELCADLITCLIRQYLGDLATTDAISARLRKVCPRLFTSDDATVAKASELLQSSKSVVEKERKGELVAESLRMFKLVAQQLHLPAVCMQFEEAQYYEGVVELVLCAAEKADPQQLGLAYYKSGQSQQDGEFSQFKQAYVTRISYYKCITDLLDRLLSSAAKDPTTNPTTTNLLKDNILKMALDSQDELCHVAIYDWLLERNMQHKFLHVKSEFLEPYLLSRISEGGARTDRFLDLLWEYYERNGEYKQASQLLLNLADKHNANVNLNQRLTYLARAVVCAKAVGDSTVSFGPFLQELQDKLEVARLQKQIVDSLQQIKVQNRNYVQEALCRLNAELLDVSQLYADYAEEFGLSECKLAIVHCAGHYDCALIETLWREIIEKELVLARQESATQKGNKLSTKLASLAKLYQQNPRYYPTEFLIRVLVEKGLECGLGAEWVGRVLTERMGVGVEEVVGVVDRLYRGRERANRRCGSFLLHILLSLLTQITDNHKQFTPSQRRKLSAKCQDITACYLVELETLPETVEFARLKESFKAVKIRLERFN